VTGWHQAHLVVLGLWGGIVLAEAVLEVVARRDPAHARTAAVVHFWIDLLCEGPVLVALLVTGGVLALRMPLTALHWAKIGCAILALGVNVWCIGVVLRRYRCSRGGEEEETARRAPRPRRPLPGPPAHLGVAPPNVVRASPLRPGAAFRIGRPPTPAIPQPPHRILCGARGM
jgi:hypothetical protein